MANIPSAFPLSPVDNNYVSSSLRYQNFTQNVDVLLLSNNVSSLVTPTLQTMGDGMVFLSGAVTITAASPTAEMLIATLANKYASPQNNILPVLVKRGANLLLNGILVDSLKGTIEAVVVTNPGTYTAVPTVSTTGPGSGATFSVNMFVLTATIVTPQAGAGSYRPNDNFTAVGGTFSAAAVFKVTTTKVVSATIANGGTGGVNGTQTITGLSGDGDQFTASVTIAGGAITAINSITYGGIYAGNPDDPSPVNDTAHPGTLTGALLSLKMGINQFSFVSHGVYSALPTNPVSVTSNGPGTGATLNFNYGINAIQVTNPGKEYDQTSRIALSGAGGGAATILLSKDASPQLKLMVAAAQNDVVYLDGLNFIVSSYS